MRSVTLQLNDKVLIPKCQVATGFFTRFMGLMGRGSISEDEAICFPNCNSIHTFFMRFPIDVLLVGAEGEVLEVVPAMGAWRMLLPRRKVKHVIELRAHQSEKLGISVGTYLDCKGVWSAV